MTDLAASFDLTPSQVATLRHLDDARSQRDLAGCLHVDASNVTDIVDRLEERGLAMRTVDPADRRVRRIVLTPEGQELQRNLFKQALATAPIASLDASEQRTLCELLGKIAEPADLPF
jgi:MarR family transcriptional regulator, organic hydroperoxide resistance regulator